MNDYGFGKMCGKGHSLVKPPYHGLEGIEIWTFGRILGPTTSNNAIDVRFCVTIGLQIWPEGLLHSLRMISFHQFDNLCEKRRPGVNLNSMN